MKEKLKDRKPYEPPVLEVFGSAEAITRGVGTGLGDTSGIGVQRPGPTPGS